MGLKEGSVVPVNLRCGCQQVTVTILHGEQRIRCPACGKDTLVRIRISDKDEVARLEVEWA